MTTKRIIGVALISIFFISLFANVGIELLYASNMPRSPQMETHRILRVTINHGSTVYVSEEELRRLHSVQTISECAMLASFVVLGILKLSVRDIWN